MLNTMYSALINIPLSKITLESGPLIYTLLVLIISLIALLIIRMIPFPAVRDELSKKRVPLRFTVYTILYTL